MSIELQKGTKYWDKVVIQLVHSFAFFDEKPTVDGVLQVIKENIFDEIPVAVASSQ